MNLETSKNLGGIGALLVVIGGLGFFGSGYLALVSLVGLILVLIAMKGLADFYSETGIFNNTLYAVILAIVGIVAFAAAIIVTVFATLAGFDWSDPSTWAQQFTDFAAFWNTFGNAIIGFIISAVVLFVFFIVAFVMFRKSLNMLASKSGVGMFATAGLLMLVGAVLTIILIGLILIWVGFILLIVAFFSIRTPPAPAAPSSQPAQAA